MSSAGEDAIPGFSTTATQATFAKSASSNIDSDSDTDSDAPPDFRFLVTTKTGVHKLPSRGTKDFEPNATNRQQSTLDASRQAMYDALSVLRVHNRSGVTVGQYFPDEADWDGAKLDEVQDGENVKDQACYEVRVVKDSPKPRASKRFRKSGALRVGEGRCVAVQRFTHTYSKTMGVADRRNWTWLLPEEALFLLERGSLDIRWPDPEQGQIARENPDETDLKIGQLPMSLQGAYACLIGKSGLTIERYTVYANLRRAGYVVLRAPTWTGPIERTGIERKEQDIIDPVKARARTTPFITQLNPFYLLRRLFTWLFTRAPRPVRIPCYNLATGPLISPGVFRNYFDIYRQLSLIPYYNYSSKASRLVGSSPKSIRPAAAAAATATSVPDSNFNPDQNPLCVSFQIYKPSSIPTFRKSSPPPPDYNLVILNARTSLLPTSSQLGHLLTSLPKTAQTPTQKSPSNVRENDSTKNRRPARIETRIKRGKRSFLLAVVDCGIVSYLRISAGGFGGKFQVEAQAEAESDGADPCKVDDEEVEHDDDDDNVDGILWRDNERREAERAAAAAAAGYKRGNAGNTRGSGRGTGRGRDRGRGRGRGRGRHKS